MNIAPCRLKKQNPNTSILSLTALLKVKNLVVQFSLIRQHLELGIKDFTQIIKDIFEEEIPDQPWCLDHWYVVENELGNAVAGLSSWIEGMNGTSSDMLKAQMLNFFLKQEWESSKEKLEVLASITIPRKNGYIQLEHLYTHADFRGQGHMKS